MAGSVSSGGRRGRWKPQAEINVTPFVDVMLVLLIVFMITAPLLTVGVEVNTPETDASTISSNSEPVTVSITSDGGIFIQETQIEPGELVPRLRAIAGSGFEGSIFIRADENTDYGTFSRIITQIRNAGFTRLSLVHSPTRTGPARDEQEE